MSRPLSLYPTLYSTSRLYLALNQNGKGPSILLCPGRAVADINVRH